MKFKQMGWFLKWATNDKVLAITLYPFGIYVKSTRILKNKDIVHETIHWKQQKEMLCIFFYLWYLIEYSIRHMYNGTDEAYRKISFEREAYQHEHDGRYLRLRKHFSWLKYL